MENLILIVHVLLAVSVIALVLLQQGKGAGMGASFGAGASQTVFGSDGSGNFMTRTTAILAVFFFATSFGLAVVAKQKAGAETDAGIPAAVSVQPIDADALPDSLEQGLLEVVPTDTTLPELD
jgi:preprotein translocase subunit SecG